MTITKSKDMPLYEAQVLDESEGVVYTFLGPTIPHTEQLVERCFARGEQTWWDTRPAVAEDALEMAI